MRATVNSVENGARGALLLRPRNKV